MPSHFTYERRGSGSILAYQCRVGCFDQRVDELFLFRVIKRWGEFNRCNLLLDDPHRIRHRTPQIASRFGAVLPYLCSVVARFLEEIKIPGDEFAISVQGIKTVAS